MATNPIQPYNPANNATMNALEAPKDHQSRGDCGYPKLKANRMKTTEFSATRNHRP